MNKVIEKNSDRSLCVKCLLLVRGVASSDACFLRPHAGCLGQARDGAKCSYSQPPGRSQHCSWMPSSAASLLGCTVSAA